ncbi:WD domain, G-beta repeat protein [Trichuris suis]|nr:WD domain, G-beta repeat protein [Trichuris suis]
MGEFKATEIIQYAKTGQALSDEEIYWQNWVSPVEFQESGSVTDVDLSSTETVYCAAACSTKVPLYDLLSGSRIREIGKFNYNALCLNIRRDGKMIAVGDESSRFRVFSMSTMSEQRHFKGHERCGSISGDLDNFQTLCFSSVRACKFTTEGYHLASFSDDFTVKYWDLATASELRSFKGHQDSVRCGLCRSANLIVSGSYDHTVRMWDDRQSSYAMLFEHGYPVESIAMDDADRLLVVAGGTVVTVWDVEGGRKLAQLSRHHKTVTGVRFCSNNSRFMSGSLDHHIKVYDVQTMDVAADMKFNGPILSFSVLVRSFSIVGLFVSVETSQMDDSFLVVGMASGLLSVRQRKVSRELSLEPAEASLRDDYGRTIVQKEENTYVVKSNRRLRLRKHDKLLKAFQYRKLVGVVTMPPDGRTHPEIAVSIFRELIRRNVLEKALSDLEGKSLLGLLLFLKRNIREPRFMNTLLEVASVLIDVSCPKALLLPKRAKESFQKLHATLAMEVADLREAAGVCGFLRSIFVASDDSFARDSTNGLSAPYQVVPTDD